MYIQSLRITKSIEKSLIYIEEYSKYFTTKLILEIFEKKNIKLKNKPQEMIKIYSNLIDYINQLIVIEKENPDQAYFMELNYKSQLYTVYKNFYIGLFYLTHKKYDELYTIMNHCQENLNNALKYFKNNKLSYNSKSMKKCEDLVKNIETLINFLLSQTFVRITEDKLKQTVLSSNQMDIDSGAAKKGIFII